MSSAVLRIRDCVIREAATDGYICLNDLWDLAGSPDSLRPRYWRRSARATALIAALEHQLQLRAAETVKSTPGKPKPLAAMRTTGHSRATAHWAHPVVALDYAETLSPDLSIEVKRVFLAKRRPALRPLGDLIERLEGEIAQDEERVSSRLALVRANRQVRGEGMAAGCVLPQDYRRLNGAHYQGLYEMGVTEIKRRKGLAEGAALPDHMGLTEMAANLLAKGMELDRLKRLRPETPERAGAIVESAAGEVRRFLESAGMPPEDLPTEPHVSTARKRMERNMELLDKVLPLTDDANLDPELEAFDMDLPPPTTRGSGSMH